MVSSSASVSAERVQLEVEPSPRGRWHRVLPALSGLAAFGVIATSASVLISDNLIDFYAFGVIGLALIYRISAAGQRVPVQPSKRSTDPVTASPSNSPTPPGSHIFNGSRDYLQEWQIGEELGHELDSAALAVEVGNLLLLSDSQIEVIRDRFHQSRMTESIKPEAWSGTGPLVNLMAEEVQECLRVFQVVRLFMELIQPVEDWEPLSMEQAIVYIRSEAGISLDPDVVGGLERVVRQRSLEHSSSQHNGSRFKPLAL